MRPSNPSELFRSLPIVTEHRRDRLQDAVLPDAGDRSVEIELHP